MRKNVGQKRFHHSDLEAPFVLYTVNVLNSQFGDNTTRQLYWKRAHLCHANIQHNQLLNTKLTECAHLIYCHRNSCGPVTGQPVLLSVIYSCSQECQHWSQLFPHQPKCNNPKLALLSSVNKESGWDFLIFSPQKASKFRGDLDSTVNHKPQQLHISCITEMQSASL